MRGGFPKPNKYGAKRTPCNAGHNHPSAKEAKRCNDLQLLEMAGAISRLEYEPQYWFHVGGTPVKHANGRRVGYKPDWRYFEGNKTVVEECKGFRTPDYVLRLAFFKAIYPGIEHRETT